MPLGDWKTRHVPAIDFRAALLSLLAASALLASWHAPGLSALWDALDTGTYLALNATVAWGTPFAELWAITGDRRFDYAAALVIIVLFCRWFLAGDRDEVRAGLAFSIYVALVLIVVITIQREILSLTRHSPSLALAAHHHAIVDYVPWSRAKEVSRSSLPGDHGTVMLLVTWLLWRSAGARIGWIAIALTVAFTVPRFAAGAHWLTDLTIGSGVSVLLAATVLLGTPLARWLYAAASKASDAMCDLWQRFETRLSDASTPPEPLDRQILRGFSIGLAHVAPGVSPSTMALMVGVYRRMIQAVAGLDAHWLRLMASGRFAEAMRRVDLVFLVPLCAGVAFAILFFSRVVPMNVLIAELPEMTFGFFFGLVAASIVSLLVRIHERRWQTYGWLLLGIGIGSLTVLIIPVSTPDDVWVLFLCGLAVATAALIPGLSVAYVLLLLGKYGATIEALGRFDWLFIAPLAAGIALGVLVFARAIRWLLAHRHTQTMLTATGIVGGSLLSIWPFQEWEFVEIGGAMRLVSSTPYLPQAFDLGVVLGLLMVGVGLLAYRTLERAVAKNAGAASPERER